MNSEFFPVIIEDDGELEAVLRVLDELEIDFAETVTGRSGRSTLLISNARHVIARPLGAAAPAGDFRIVVLDKASKTIRLKVERLACDFVLQGPIDPVALGDVAVERSYT